MAEGTKYDQNKIDWSILPWEELEWVARVCHNGGAKYAPSNWKKVKRADKRYIAAAIRHIVAHLKGEVYDAEWGFPHLAHAVCSLLYCMHFQDYRMAERRVNSIPEEKYEEAEADADY